MLCPGCGAVYADSSDTCASRFDLLLALDHSRTEPWGSRHGLAFAAFALQHGDRYPRQVLERAWLLLHCVYVEGIDVESVARGLSRSGKDQPRWNVPPLPSGMPAPPFAKTIADLGDFPAERYPSQLEEWCQAALAGWRSMML